MSYETIHAMSRAAAIRALSEDVEPYQPRSANEVELYGTRGRPFPFPNLGDYRPAGWVMVEYVMADSSGFGSEREPALTIPALRQWVINWMSLDDTIGFGIISAGQFQVIVAAFSQADDAEPCDGCTSEDDITDQSVSYYWCPECGSAIEDGEENCYVCDWYKEDEDEEDEEEDEEVDEEAMLDGYIAFKDGKGLDDNPHLPFTTEADSWQSGYLSAKAKETRDILDNGQQTLDLGE